MAIMPPFEPMPPQDRDNSPRSQEADPNVRYVSSEEATEDDRVTFFDRLAIFGAIATAQLIRLAIIALAVGIIVLVIFIGSKV